jgi:hypothetical protein
VRRDRGELAEESARQAAESAHTVCVCECVSEEREASWRRRVLGKQRRVCV